MPKPKKTANTSQQLMEELIQANINLEQKQKAFLRTLVPTSLPGEPTKLDKLHSLLIQLATDLVNTYQTSHPMFNSRDMIVSNWINKDETKTLLTNIILLEREVKDAK
jgi:hypothetical protein